LRHQLPEERPGAAISQADARALVHGFLGARFGLDPVALKEISAEPAALPGRQDWSFTFADTAGYPLQEGESRLTVQVAGDQVVDAYRYLHVPEEWERTERNQRNMTGSIRSLCTIILGIVTVAGVVAGVVRWGRRRFTTRTFLLFLGILIILRLVETVNAWPGDQAGFSTAEPFANQAFISIAFSLLGAILISLAGAFVVGFIHSWKSHQPTSQRVVAKWMALAGGLMMVGALAVVRLASPSLTPAWANYHPLDCTVPVLSVARRAVDSYILVTAIVLLGLVTADRLSAGWSQRRGVVAAGLFLFGLLLCSPRAESIPFWLAQGVVVGAGLLLGYRLLFRYQLAVIPLATLPIALAGAARQMFYSATPAAIPGGIVAILACVLFALFWSHRLGVEDLAYAPDRK
jgi:hypothetical protein